MNKFKTREKQLQKETLDLFKKLSLQTSITKTNLIKLSRKLKSLKEIDNEKYRNLSNQLTAFTNTAKGLNSTKNLIKFHKIYADFLECIDVDDNKTE